MSRVALRGEAAANPVLKALACAACPARKSDICGGLDDVEIRDLSASSQRIRLARGETLIRDGDEAKFAYVVTRGALRAQRGGQDGRRQILDFLFAGQFIVIPSNAVYHFDAEALTDVEVCRFPRSKLEDLMTKHAAVGTGYRKGAAKQMEAAYDHAYALGQGTAAERVAGFILELQGSACARTTGGALHLPMTRGDIADFLGLTLETVSRTFSRLKAAGIIRLPSAQEIEIRDTARLKALASGNAL
jgi:CRP/FNR family transcriptional regulator